jgi:hypothetical protein
MLDQSDIISPSLGPVVTCDGALAQGRAMVPLSLDVFALAPSERKRETKAERAERVAAMAEIRALFARERRAQRHAAIRMRVGVRRARTSHRVGAAKPTTSSGDDDGDGDPEPPGKLETVAVATVTPSGRPITVALRVDPARTDAATMLFLARQAAGHDLTTCTRGLDRVRVEVVHPYATRDRGQA